MHGTKSLSNALSIKYEGKWVIGDSIPYGVWLTNSMHYAKQIAGHHGVILEVSAAPDLEIEQLDNRRFLIKDLNGYSGKEIVVYGLDVLKIMDFDGKVVA